MAENVLYYGDNLEILRRYIKGETVDLVYLDPPFKSDQDYNILFAERNGSQAAAQIKAFEDTWHWDKVSAAAYQEIVETGPTRVSQVMQAFRTFLGENDMMAYLSMMAPRLVELQRAIKQTGSIYLHCDPTASHYLKMLMDAVFGIRNFRSEIIWRRTNAHNKILRKYGPIHDVILFYTKTDNFVFHPGTRPYSKGYIGERFVHVDSRGRYQTNYLTGPGIRTGDSGKEWRGFNPTKVGRHWAIPASLLDFLPDRGKGMNSQEKLECLFQQDLIVFPKKAGGQPMYKQYVGKGVFYQDTWAYQPNTRGVLYNSDECIDEDVKYLESEEEKLGFETQKPVGLLERIIKTSSDEQTIILDPFCGCGTTIVAAQKMNRRWIGIDITHLAVALMKHRLHDMFGSQVQYKVIGEPVSLPDAKALAENDPYQFQWWALGLVGARPIEEMKGADRGIDGRLYFHDEADSKKGRTKQIILSVKSGKVSVKDVRDLRGVVEREEAQIGVLICMQKPTRDMRRESASAGFYKSHWGTHQKLQILTIEELLTGHKIDYPDIAGVNVTFRRAQKAKTKQNPHPQFDCLQEQ